MALIGFTVLLLVSAAPEVLANIKKRHCVLPLILQLKLSHNAIENKVYYHLATTLYYLSNKERKLIGRPEVIGEAKGGRGQGNRLSQLKCQ